MKISLFSLMVVAVALAGCGVTDRGQAALRAGLRALEQGRNERSLRLLHRAIDKGLSKRQEAVAHNGAGLALWRLGDRGMAMMAFETGMDADPTLADPIYNIGVMMEEEGERSEAIAFLEKAALTDGRETRALERLAGLHRRTGYPDEARRALNEALLRAPRSPRIITSLAALDLEAGEAEKAVAGFQLALENDAAYAPAIYNLGIVNDRWLDDRDQARAYFKEYVRLSPEGPHAEAARTALKGIEGDEPAVELEEAAPDPAPLGYDDYMRMADLLDRQGRVEAAVHNFLRAAVTAESENKPEREKRAVSNAVHAAKESAPAHYALGSYFMKRGRNAEARKHLELSTALDGTRAAAHIALAEVLVLNGEFDAAVVSLVSADRVEPSEPDALWLLAELYDRRMGLVERAVLSYAGFVRRFPDDPRADKARQRISALEAEKGA